MNYLVNKKINKLLKLGSNRYLVKSNTLIRFDKENFLLAGWISSDQYNNQVTFEIEINSINQMIDKKIFTLPNRN